MGVGSYDGPGVTSAAGEQGSLFVRFCFAGFPRHWVRWRVVLLPPPPTSLPFNILPTLPNTHCHVSNRKGWCTPVGTARHSVPRTDVQHTCFCSRWIMKKDSSWPCKSAWLTKPPITEKRLQNQPWARPLSLLMWRTRTKALNAALRCKRSGLKKTRPWIQRARATKRTTQTRRVAAT